MEEEVERGGFAFHGKEVGDITCVADGNKEVAAGVLLEGGIGFGSVHIDDFAGGVLELGEADASAFTRYLLALHVNDDKVVLRGARRIGAQVGVGVAEVGKRLAVVGEEGDVQQVIVVVAVFGCELGVPLDGVLQSACEHLGDACVGYQEGFLNEFVLVVRG